MPKKSKRIVAPRILFVLEQNDGKGMRFSAIFKDLAKKGWLHSQHPISQNLKYLIAQGKVARIGNQYSLIQTREDGTKFVIVEDPVERTVELE